MSYIRIANEAGQVPRKFLEKLGISSKRGDDSTIGQYGSGSKLAPIAALRKGIEWVICSNDELGPYQMRYVSEADEDGIEQVFFDYGTHRVESSYTLDAGLLSWDNPFQIFREAFANAVDAKIEFDADVKLDIVNDVEPIEGYFCVFLTATDEMQEFVDNIEKYFSMFRTTLWESEDGSLKIFDRKYGENLVYCKGVLANYGQNVSFENFLFDYEFKNLELNEERRIKSTYSVDGFILNTLQELDCPNVINTIVQSIRNGDDPKESNLYSYEGSTYTISSPLWKQIWGETDVIHDDFVNKTKSALLSSHGRIPFTTSTFWYNFLKSAKIDTVSDVLGDGAKFDFYVPNSEEMKMFQWAKSTVQDLIGYNVDMGVRFFQPQDKLIGLCNGAGIFLSKELFDRKENLLGTLVHELDHYYTGITDEDRDFRSVADGHIGNLLMKVCEDRSN